MIDARKLKGRELVNFGGARKLEARKLKARKFKGREKLRE